MEIQSVSRRTAIGASWLIAWRMFTRVLGVGSTLVMARILVPADFGLVAMATAFSAAIDAFSQFGLQQALVRRTADDNSLHDTAFTLQVARATITGLGIALCAPAVATWFAEPRLGPILFVLAALSVVGGFRNIGVVAFSRDMRYDRQFVLLCVPRLIQVAVTIPAALILQSYWALILGIVISKTLDLAMTYVLHPYRPRLSLAGWRELMSFSLWTWAASIASIIWDRSDPFIIGPAVGSAELGVFLLAVEIAILPISELVVPASDALFAGFSLAQKEGSKPLSLALPVATALLLVIMPVMIAISCTGGYMVAAVLGLKWAEAQPLVAVATWLGLFSPYSFVCTTALVAAGHVRANFVANVLASVVKLAALTVAVAFTHDLLTITTVGVLVVGLESLVFVVCVVRAGGGISASTSFALARVLATGALSLGLVVATGLAWKPVVLAPGQALLQGAGVGCGAIILFVILTAAGWRLSGRPQGPETRVAGLLVQVAGPIWARIAILVTR